MIIFSLVNKDSEIKPSSTKQYLIILPLLLLFVLGFLIMQWYYFILIIVIFMFDPFQILFPKLYFNKFKLLCMNIVDKHFYTLFAYYNLSALGLWVNYQNFAT